MARLRAGATVACLLTLALLLAGCGGKDDATTKTGPSTSVPDTSSTTTEPITTVAAAATTRPATAPPTSPAASTAPGPSSVKPAAAGTYRYATTGSTTFGLTTVPYPAVTTLVVDPAAGTRQHSNRDLRDAAGTGPMSEFTLDYRADGIYLESLRLTVNAGGATDSRELRPPAPALFLPTGARPGSSRTIDLATPSGAAKVVIDVLAEERVVVGGQAVDTLVVKVTATLPPGDVTGRVELTLNVDKGSALWVKEHSVTEASASGGLLQLRSQYDAVLQRLTPG